LSGCGVDGRRVVFSHPDVGRPAGDDALCYDRAMSARDESLQQLRDGSVFDVVVVGGGINGAVAAAAASARGGKVALVDRGDFGGETSQSSSNLAWGGIKYLETYEFGLVRKLCVSRNHLLKALPSHVREIRFFVAHERGFRHGLWKLWLGSLLYWFIGDFFTKRPRLLSTATIQEEEPVIDVRRLDGGFEYSDAMLPDLDARFVWTFIRTAIEHGAVAANYVESTGARFEDGLWTVSLRDVRTDERFSVKARALVNAAGPWVDAHNGLTSTTTKHRHVFSKGIHLIVPRITPHERVLTFFADDGRLFFVIPMGDRTCVGTTDTRVPSPDAAVTDEDRHFVLDNINKRLLLKKPLTPKDVLSERCGVRPLVVNAQSNGQQKDWFQLSRKHVIETDVSRRHVSIYGGKLTDCVNIGEEITAELVRLGVALSKKTARWYGESDDDRARFSARAQALGLGSIESEAHGVTEPVAARLWRRYGKDALGLLDAIEADPREKEPVLPGCPELRCEVRFAGRTEMVTTLEDYLRRRTTLLLTQGRAQLLGLVELSEVCALLFGRDAEARLADFVRADDAEAAADVVTAGRARALVGTPSTSVVAAPM
jgi:glycerol-3-phosphate dehydrogenase